MELCISSGNFDDAMDLAEQYKITLTESMAEGMTMEKKLRGDKDYKSHNQKRRTILTRIAALAQQQGEFNIATKKYAEAGNSKGPWSRCCRVETPRGSSPSLPCAARKSVSSS